VPSPLPTVVPAIGRSPDGFEVSTTYRSQAVARVPGLDSGQQRPTTVDSLLDLDFQEANRPFRSEGIGDG
jgi:hypothetical protein